MQQARCAQQVDLSGGESGGESEVQDRYMVGAKNSADGSCHETAFQRCGPEPEPAPAPAHVDVAANSQAQLAIAARRSQPYPALKSSVVHAGSRRKTFASF